MIELISASRCVKCDRCVRVCPTNVFDGVPGGIPVIARQSDCQTCYACELYCPADAMYVAPESYDPVEVDEEDLVARGLLGSYREAVGFGPRGVPISRRDPEHILHRLLGSEIR